MPGKGRQSWDGHKAVHQKMKASRNIKKYRLADLSVALPASEPTRKFTQCWRVRRSREGGNISSFCGTWRNWSNHRPSLPCDCGKRVVSCSSLQRRPFSKQLHVPIMTFLCPNLKRISGRCWAPNVQWYSFAKHIYQNKMHAERFSWEGCMSKGRHQISSVLRL